MVENMLNLIDYNSIIFNFQKPKIKRSENR